MFITFGYLGCKKRFEVSFLPDILVSFFFVCDLLDGFYLSVKNCPCSLWVKILANLRLGLIGFLLPKL